VKSTTEGREPVALVCSMCGLPILSEAGRKLGASRVPVCGRCFTVISLVEGVKMDLEVDAVERALSVRDGVLISRYNQSVAVN